MAEVYSKKVVLRVKDHSVSGEEFELIENSKFGYLETSPQPPEGELLKYYESEDYISHTSSRRNLFERVYHWVRIFTLRSKLRLINKYSTKDKNLLDLGCGTGDFLLTAQRNGWSIAGVEPNQGARNLANTKINNSVFNSDKFFELQSESFDVITLWHVLEHLPNLEKYIAQFKKILKQDGTLFVAVPNYKSYDAKQYGKFWAAYDAPRHLWHFNQNSITKLFNEYNFEVIRKKAMWFDSFYVSLLSEKFKMGKMNFLRGFGVGFISNLKSIWSKEPSSVIYIIKKAKN